jgi:hypothetical protein
MRASQLLFTARVTPKLTEAIVNSSRQYIFPGKMQLENMTPGSGCHYWGRLFPKQPRLVEDMASHWVEYRYLQSVP